MLSAGLMAILVRTNPHFAGFTFSSFLRNYVIVDNNWQRFSLYNFLFGKSFNSFQFIIPAQQNLTAKISIPGTQKYILQTILFKMQQSKWELN